MRPGWKRGDNGNEVSGSARHCCAGHTGRMSRKKVLELYCKARTDAVVKLFAPVVNVLLAVRTLQLRKRAMIVKIRVLYRVR